MSESFDIPILPYTRVVGQDQLKLALELAYIEPRIGGVLISGERGTGKSTIVRAFARMVYGHLPVTIPINATEDRVIGGWKINELVQGRAEEQAGLLEEANGKLLYVDEVNLLDDHIVNIILDVTSTGVLVIQREGIPKQKAVKFTLVGTMNPEEGSLRPQLLDRFGFMVQVTTDTHPELRYEILQAVLDFDNALEQRDRGLSGEYFDETRKEMEQYNIHLKEVRENIGVIELTEQIVECCAVLAYEFEAEGHRSEYGMVLAARAYAALQGHRKVSREDIECTAPLILRHRRPVAQQLNRILWSEEDQNKLNNLLKRLSVKHE